MIINTNVVGIIADDLTGANDSALQFHLKGSNTHILLNDESTPANIENAQTWAISTESRNVVDCDAYEKVKKTTQMYLELFKPDHFFKKIDSTVRGNIAIEVLGVLETLDWDAAVVIPAFPREKRITVGGYHLLNGEPVERTEMARDPHSPISESYLPKLFKSQLPDECGEVIAHIDLDTVTEGAGPILKRINDLIKDGKKLIVADAVSNTDIDQLALAITKSEYKILPAGTAASARAFSNIWVSEDEEERQKPILPNLPKLVISGSATQITANQIDKFEKNNESGAYILSLDLPNVLEGVQIDLVDDVVSNLNSNRTVLIHTSNLFKNYSGISEESLSAELTKAELADAITEYLAELTKQITDRQDVILITLGGETSYKCCAKIGINQLELVDEVAPAIALSKDNKDRFVVTKSGNLGGANTLIDILEYFQEG